MTLNRREFLKLIGASAVVAALPAFSGTREPYVTEKCGPVSYVGPNGKNSFIGAKIVREVLPFDGVGYPVRLGKDEWCYDFDLSDMLKDMPDKFWHSEENRKRYPNIHTYIREQRFGETIPEAILTIQNGNPLPKDWERYF